MRKWKELALPSEESKTLKIKFQWKTALGLWARGKNVTGK